MIAAHHVDLGDVVGAEAAVGRRVVVLERLDHAAFQRRDDFAAGKLGDLEAHALHDVGGQADGAILEALQIVGALDLLLEPAERLRRHRHAEEADQVPLEDILDKLPVELLAAALVDPGENFRGVGAEHRAGAEQRRRLVLAVPVGGDQMPGIEHALVDRVLDLERLHHRAGVQVLDLQTAAGHVVDPLHVFQRHFVEDVGRAPGALHLEGDGLRPRDIRKRHRRRRGAGRDAGAGQEFAARNLAFSGFFGFANDRHVVVDLFRHFRIPPIKLSGCPGRTRVCPDYPSRTSVILNGKPWSCRFPFFIPFVPSTFRSARGTCYFADNLGASTQKHKDFRAADR